MTTLLDKKCSHATVALASDAIVDLLGQVPGWSLLDNKLYRSFSFRNYHETIDFVNALAAMVHAEDHHPELFVTYKECGVAFSTHSVHGISENDFICAAKANAIYQKRAGA